ncbi:MAG: peptidylprolyl isomerase [Rhodobacteraceae bacterium]|nr:peptidylprolyl isomerase [Paracoccaceae bacterium]
MRLTPLFAALLMGVTLTATPGLPQGAFSPAIEVNDDVVTGFELDQRIKFLTLLQFPGDIQAEAERGLIEDRLRLRAAKAMGLSVSADQINAGMAEFAGRANLQTDQFLQAISQGGIEPESFRDFVEAGLVWREVVRTRFGGRIAVSEAEIDRALSADSGRGAGPQVLLSELYIPAQAGGIGKATAQAKKIAEKANSEAAFAEAARLHSAGISRLDGGRVDWIPASNLPPQVAAAISTLGQGQVSEPVPMPGAVGLFYVRGMRDGAALSKAAIFVDYAELTLPVATAQAEAVRIRETTDTCDDLYTQAKGLPTDQLRRQTLRRGQLPADLGAVIDGLDANEQRLIQRNGQSVLVMLCTRNASLAANAVTPVIPPVDPATGTTATLAGTPAINKDFGLGQGPSRDQLREELTSRKLVQLADAYLAELKAEAIIRRP